MRIIFYNFPKKENSTARPDGQVGFTIEGNLRASTSIMAPVFEIQHAGILTYNYAYIPEFNRYYFVTNIASMTNNLWIVALGVDVLASFKDEIAKKDCYVLRSSYDADGNIIYDGNIVDGAYPVTAEPNAYANSVVQSPFAGDSLDIGSFVVGVVNKKAGVGAVTYYLMNFDEFQIFNNYLFQNTNWTGISSDELSPALTRVLTNPYQYVVSCNFCPFTVGWFEQSGIVLGQKTQIYFGWWEATNCRAYQLALNTEIIGTISIPIPKHPAAASRGAYLNLSPYSIYTLRFYPFGTITLDSSILSGWSNLDCQYVIDCVTGAGILNLSVGGRTAITRTIQSQLFATVPTAAMQTDLLGINTGTIVMAGAYNTLQSPEVGAALATEGGLFEKAWAFGGALVDRASNWVRDNVINPSVGIESGASSTGGGNSSDIISATMAMASAVDIQGQQGCISFLNMPIILSGRFSAIAAEDLDHRGRPLCRHKRIDELSGYIQIADDDLSFTGTMVERSAIIGYMTNGFYFE